ncbi:MAG TPA: tetratricopeptide repeat protein [Dongiaceae bacterium]|jgi:TPR repeat protein|nr:tetratricopeptide repeat protein [Dongiaceae bacterium]
MADYQTGVEAYSKGKFKDALNEWLPLAEAGDATAQNAVGAIYDRGLGVDKDDAAAVHWYQLAADQSFPLAMRNLASMYAGGHGVPFDKDQAEYWYQKAAEAGDPVAIKHMAGSAPSSQFASAPAVEPNVAGTPPAEAAPPPAEPMTVAGGDQQAAAEASAAPQAPAESTPGPQQAASTPASAGTGDSDQAPQYGDGGTATAAASGGTAAPAATQEAAMTTPPPAMSDPSNWLIGMWQGPSLGCPPGGGLEFVPGETRSYYEGQIAARLPAKYQVSGDKVSVTSTGVDGVGHTYEYERTGSNTFVITSVPPDMPKSMIGIEHRRCASAPLAAAAAPAPASAPAAKPAVAAKPASATQPAPGAVPVKPVTEAQQPKPVAGAEQTAAKTAPAAPASAQAGWDAFGRGDYKGALSVWQPLAEQGDVSMQLLVGSIYDYGQGVPQDDAEAAKWYERAAVQGSAKGQYQLGAVYARSAQVKNPVEGYKWLTVAARTLANGPQGGITADQATTLRTLLESEMSKDEITKAKQEADVFKATKG